MSEFHTPGSPRSILVVGGGISGMTAAVEAAEAGRDVYLVEREASLGGWVARFKLYYPKMCPPACGLEVNYQRIRRNRRIRVMTCTEVRAVKIVLERPLPSGDLGERDVYGAQQHAPLLGLEVPA